MSRTVKIIVLSLLMMAVLAVSFGVGCIIGASNAPQAGLDVVQEAWEIIFQKYVDNDQLDADVLAQGAVKGMVEALDDPYTYYLDAETYQLSLGELQGQFEGIGAYVAVKDDQIVVIAPIAGSPAEAAGIRAGDIILEVDGQSTEGMSLLDVVLNVQGPQGTMVTLVVLHEGETEAETIDIVRAVIEVPSVEYEMMEEIACIAITHFSERTADELLPVIEEVNQQASAIILDLRGNPGGLLDTVVDVVGFFLTEGVVLDVVDNQGNHDVYPIQTAEITTELPLVVLVDGSSASGSEVLAGALQDYGRATIAGAQTFGKGSVNILYQFDDGSGIYITSARWLTPNGRLIEGEGLAPDYELGEEEDAIQWAIDYLRSY